MNRANCKDSIIALGFFLAAWIFAAEDSCAAKIEVDRSRATPFVEISGPLTIEDGERFADKVSGLNNAVVLMLSEGGNLVAGLRIGKLIRLKKFDTAVPDGWYCASACAIAWLGGSTRYMGQTALIGFHAAFRVDNGVKTETGAGNALVGAYLNGLGLSDDAILYMTSAPPNEIARFSIDAARRLGIPVTLLTSIKAPATSEPKTQTPKAPTVPLVSPPSRAPATAVDIDDTARAFAATYFAHWSENNDDALRYFRGVYGPRIRFVDRSIARDDLLDQKRKYAERWPERIYIAVPATIKADCDRAKSTCTVTGQVEWDCRDPKRNAQSTGLADFTLQIKISDAGAASIFGEWSTVARRD